MIADQESGAGEGYYAFVPMALIYEDDDLSPAVRAWLERYKERYNAQPTLPAMLGYRGADLVVHGLEIAGPDITREGLISAIRIAHRVHGLVRQYAVLRPQRPQGRGPLHLGANPDGRWVALQTTISF